MGTLDLTAGFDACHLSRAAKKVCELQHMTPRRFEPLSSSAASPDTEDMPVLRVWNSKREIVITSGDLAYVRQYYQIG
jgi:hypothetical protein